jgi:hypothetical protein
MHPQAAEKNRQAESLLLRSIALNRQSDIADKTGLSTSQINRIVTGHAGITLDRIGSFMDAIGLAIVSTKEAGGMVVLDNEEHQALRTLARSYLETTSRHREEQA